MMDGWLRSREMTRIHSFDKATNALCENSWALGSSSQTRTPNSSQKASQRGSSTF